MILKSHFCMVYFREENAGRDEEKEQERLFSAPVRLLIMAELLTGNVSGCTELLDLLKLTRGNISSHMKQLSDADYFNIVKEFAGNRP